MIFDLYKFDESGEYIEKFINPCCCNCFHMLESSFFKFINVFDIVYTLAVFAFNFMTHESGKIFKTVSLGVSVVWFGVSLFSLISFCSRKNYGTGYHMFYAVIRIAFCAIILMALGAAMERDYNKSFTSDSEISVWKVFTKMWKRICLTIPMQLFNLSWSFLFYMIVSNRVEVNKKIRRRDESFDQAHFRK